MKGDRYKVALEIMKAVAGAYGVTLEDLRSHSRVARLATARAVVCYLLYRYYNYSLKDVGRMVLRDHSSVMHSVRLVEGFNLWPTMYAVDLNIINNIKQKLFSDAKTMD